MCNEFMNIFDSIFFQNKIVKKFVKILFPKISYRNWEKMFVEMPVNIWFGLQVALKIKTN